MDYRDLTPREFEIACLRADRIKLKDIAIRCNIDEQTVKNTLRIVYQKLEIPRWIGKEMHERMLNQYLNRKRKPIDRGEYVPSKEPEPIRWEGMDLLNRMERKM